MNLHTLKPAKGSVRNRKRIARGQGSGKGGTATKGHKGQQARTGYSRKKGNEGGQMPLIRRLPKFGFNNIHRIEFRTVNIDVLQKIAENKKIAVFDKDVFIQLGLIGKNDLVKILGNGKLTSRIEVKAHGFSKKAKEAIEALDGKAEILS